MEVLNLSIHLFLSLFRRLIFDVTPLWANPDERGGAHQVSHNSSQLSWKVRGRNSFLFPPVCKAKDIHLERPI